MRYVDPDLLDCLRRPDSYTEYAVEVSAPDVGQVLRRANDQFLTDPPGVPGTQTGAFAQAATGGLQLATTPVQIVAFGTGASPGEISVGPDNEQRQLKGLAWKVDPTFARAVARTFTARLLDTFGGPPYSPFYRAAIDWQLQIYRVTRTPGTLVTPGALPTLAAQYAFTPLLSPAPIVKGPTVTWDGLNQAVVSWDLSPYALAFESTPTGGIDPTVPTELPIYLFVINGLNVGAEAQNFHWLLNTTTPQAVASVGTFMRETWSRTTDDGLWKASDAADTPMCTISVDSYGVNGSKVYHIDLGRAPTAGTQGRVVFERNLPRGTAAAVELATVGSTGPWTAVLDGDVIATAQRDYWLRLTLTSDAAHRSSPIVNGFGVEFRIPYDVGDLSIASTPSRDITPPTLEASIAEATLRVVRVGERDYLDPATLLGSTAPTSKLEVDIFLRSRHPLLFTDRSKWLRLERLAVADRDPSHTSESFSLLSYSKNLATKIPAQVETINSLHTVQASTTTTAILVSPVLLGTSVGGHEYTGKNYYLRVRSTTSAHIPVGYSPVISGSTGTGQLDVAAGVFPGALQPGDVIEVHSGITTTPSKKWVDADPADVWDDVLAMCPNVSADRIGRGDLPRSGRPPRLTDRFPGDAATQAKGKVSLELKEQKEAGKLLDQVSFWMGGSTVEIGGQICFVQIYPLTALDGTITVPVAPVAAVFDQRDIVAGSLKTKPNVASRKAVVTAKYGINNAAPDPGQYPPRTTRAVDGDAVEFLSKGDLSFVGTEELSDDLCRWLYNTADLGLYLASLGTRQVCLACSTGIRVFPFQTIDAWPELTLGDTVIVVTDQYTDYDPARKLALSGWLAIRGVLVHVGPDARDFAIFVLGLADGVQKSTAVAGPLIDNRTPILKNFRWSDLETTRTFAWVRGDDVHGVWVYETLIPVGGGEGWPVDGTLPTTVLPVGTDTYAVQKPPAGYQRYVQFDPRRIDGTPGDVRRAIVDPAPSALAGKVRAAVTNGAADLTLELNGSASNWPVAVALFEDDPDGAAIYATSISAPTTIDKLTAGAAVLGARALPLRALRRWYVRLTDVAGVKVWGVSSADRDPLPAGSVTPSDYRSTPSLTISYDTDTDVIRVTVPGGKTKSFSVAGGGVVTYTVSDLLDDATVESALTRGETRAGYLVEVQGGGVWVTVWNGPLHGAGYTYAQAIATVTGSSPTTITVTVTSSDPTGSPTVQLVGVTGSATLNSGPAVGVPSASGTVWVFNRGAALGGSGQAQFRAVLAGSQSDDDLVEIPEQGRDTVYLASRARVIATAPTSVTVRYAVADPYPQGANSVTVAYQDQGSGGVTPASGGTLTPAATLTEAAGTYIDYVITRPAFAAGTARVTFTATAANRISDSDAVDVPAQERDTVGLSVRARVTATTSTAVTVRVAVADPYPQGAASATIAYQDLGSGGVSPSSGGTVTPAATLTEAAGTYIDYTITRPAAGSGTARVTFTATAGGRVSDVDAVDVPAQETNYTLPTLDLAPTISSTQYSIAFTSTGTVTYKIDAGSFGAATSPVVVTRGAADQVVTFKAVLNGQTVYGFVTVNATAPAPTPTFSGVSLAPDTNAQYTGAGTTNLKAQWTVTNAPSGATYDITVEEQLTATTFDVTEYTNVTSGMIHPSTAPILYKSSGANNKTVKLTVRVISGGGVVATSQIYIHTWKAF
jgi:hypothetical protein